MQPSSKKTKTASVASADRSTDLGEAETFPQWDTSRISRTPGSVYTVAGEREGSRMLATAIID